MSLDILLSGGVRSNVASLRQTNDLMTIIQNRLATGKDVNSALDNPVNFFMAATLNQRATDLNTLFDGINNGQKTLDAASTGIAGITNLVTTLQSVANSALASVETTARRTGTVTGLTGASSFTVASGHTITVNDGTTTATITSTGTVTVQQVNGGSLTVKFNETGTSTLNVTGVTDTSAGLGVTVSQNTWQTDADIKNALNAATAALTTLRTQSSTFGSQASVISARSDFTKSL